MRSHNPRRTRRASPPVVKTERPRRSNPSVDVTVADIGVGGPCDVPRSSAVDERNPWRAIFHEDGRINQMSIFPTNHPDPKIREYLGRANARVTRMWEPSTWDQRGSVVRRYHEFLDKYGIPLGIPSVVAFLESLGLKSTSIMQYGQFLARYVTGGPTAMQMYLKGVRREMAETPLRQAMPMTFEQFTHIYENMTNERDRLMFRVAWMTASRWADVKDLTKSNFLVDPDDTSRLILDFGTNPKTRKSDPYHESGYVAIEGEEAQHIARALADIKDPHERITLLETGQIAAMLREYGLTAHSIKRGALTHGMAQIREHGLPVENISRLAKHSNYAHQIPGTTVRYLGPATALLNGSAGMTRLMTQQSSETFPWIHARGSSPSP